MVKAEYIETIVIGGKMVNIGQDDSGQCYFVEWVDKNGNLQQESCGTYNFHYKEYAEYKFGKPEIDCPFYRDAEKNYNENCKERNKFGYCDHCFYQDIKWSYFKTLIDLGIVDRRGNVLPPYDNFIAKKEEEKDVEANIK